MIAPTTLQLWVAVAHFGLDFVSASRVYTIHFLLKIDNILIRVLFT